MNRLPKSFIYLIAVVFIAASLFPVLGQTDPEAKRAAAKAAADEAAKLRDVGNFASYQKALEKFQLAAKLYEELGDKPFVGYSYLGLAMVKSSLDETQDALEWSLKALALFHEAGPNYLEATALHTIGGLYNRIGDRAKALESFEQALQIRKAMGDEMNQAIILNSIGLVYKNSGDRKKALEFISQSLSILEKLGDKGNQAFALNNIGQIYSDLGEHQKALDYYARSITIQRAFGNKEGVAIALNNIGLANRYLGNTAEAISFYQQSLAVFSELGLESRKALILSNIGSAYLERQEPQKALDYALQALPLLQAMKARNDEITSLNNIAVAKLDLGETEDAMKYFNQALLLVKTTQAKGLESGILGNLMKASFRLNKREAAIFYGKQSIEVYQAQRVAIRELDPLIQKSYLKKIEDNYRLLADLLIESGRFKQADEVLQMLKDQEYFEFVRRDADEVNGLTERLSLTEKEKQLLARYTLLAEEALKSGQELQKLTERKRLLNREGKTLSDDEEKKYAQLNEQVAQANTAFRVFLDKGLIEEIGIENVRKIEVDTALQSKLRKFGNGTVAVSTVVTKDRYRVVVTTRDVQLDGKFEISSADLNKKIFAFREALQNTGSDPRPLGKELYDILIKPIENVLTTAKAKTLIWSLDGNLRYIPLAALSPDGKSYLLERYQTVLLTPQTRDDIDSRRVEWRAVGLGVSTEQTVQNPDQPDQMFKMSALPAIESELKAIIRENGSRGETGILAGKRFLNKEFTLKNLTNSLSKEKPGAMQRFTVVHLASHFRLAKNWSDSFLLLGNGKILTLEELSNSKDIDFGAIDLVTLSACNTAAGEESTGGEIDSLAGLIQRKNGRSVLATLWEVEDRSTASLMSNFYRIRKANPKLTKAEALQSAQKILIHGDSAAKHSTGHYSHPSYWSPFVLIGNWR